MKQNGQIISQPYTTHTYILSIFIPFCPFHKYEVDMINACKLRFYLKATYHLQVTIRNITEYFYGTYDAIAWNVVNETIDLGGENTYLEIYNSPSLFHYFLFNSHCYKALENEIHFHKIFFHEIHCNENLSSLELAARLEIFTVSGCQSTN